MTKKIENEATGPKTALEIAQEEFASELIAQGRTIAEREPQSDKILARIIPKKQLH